MLHSIWGEALTPEDHEKIREHLQERLAGRAGEVDLKNDAAREILVCGGGSCRGSASNELSEILRDELTEEGLGDEIAVVCVGCIGLCSSGPLLVVSPEGICYSEVTPAAARRIVKEHLVAGGKTIPELELQQKTGKNSVLRSRSVPFLARQVRVALRNCGVVNPLRIEESIARDGYRALTEVLSRGSRSDALELVKRSGLRGRGGAGFPTGLKWEIVREAPENTKYVVCNGDEGDPGAFMDRSILEGDPHSVIEGMAIGAFAVGASHGFVYVRAEYGLALEHLEHALAQARRCGVLGEGILGFDFDFDLTLSVGGGAFVCGEETALVSSIEGRRGVPRPRPPFPAQVGINGKPTLVGNVETWVHVAPIILNGPNWFAAMGTSRSRGTKVFALSGAVQNTGLVEVPMGTTLRELVYEIGGGVAPGRRFKGALTGGPSGGCIPASQADRPLDFDSLLELGAMMGSGGLIVIDETTCAVDLARFFVEFAVEESCGKCPPCRVGTRRMLDILERIAAGEGQDGDVDQLQELALHIRETSMCGLGQTAPNPVLSTLRHFRDEFDAHIDSKRCPAGQCPSLLTYTVYETLCDGCMMCKEVCPADAIKGEEGRVHRIDHNACARCGACLSSCPVEAIVAT
ncbi:MAG: NADH-quinone oxidoreductase subunit NuoF [bacterium]|nr:NADH-quinone oxidoreductase subunit NuoF [bacterium]